MRSMYDHLKCFEAKAIQVQRGFERGRLCKSDSFDRPHLKEEEA